MQQAQASRVASFHQEWVPGSKSGEYPPPSDTVVIRIFVPLHSLHRFEIFV
ncbi:MAG: hypothetical protein ABIP63_09585 [Thermoanaerobaculia bacterium]